jgi:hypothetical protein
MQQLKLSDPELLTADNRASVKRVAVKGAAKRTQKTFIVRTIKTVNID